MPQHGERENSEYHDVASMIARVAGFSKEEFAPKPVAAKLLLRVTMVINNIHHKEDEALTYLA